MKKINILKYAKFQGIICSIIGLLFGVIYSFGGLIVDSLVTLGMTDPIIWDNTPGLSYGTFLAFLSLIAMPLYFGGIGFIFGLVGAFLFNKLKHLFKNIDLNFEQ
jgi:hypothetical protein